MANKQTRFVCAKRLFLETIYKYNIVITGTKVQSLLCLVCINNIIKPTLYDEPLTTTEQSIVENWKQRFQSMEWDKLN